MAMRRSRVAEARSSTLGSRNRDLRAQAWRPSDLGGPRCPKILGLEISDHRSEDAGSRPLDSLIIGRGSLGEMGG
eukprot:1089423-Pyramimonas_sp.AAC.1